MTLPIHLNRNRLPWGAGFFLLAFLTLAWGRTNARATSAVSVREEIPGLAMSGQAFNYRILVDWPEAENWILELTNQEWLGPFRVKSTGELRGQVTRMGARVSEVQVLFELEATSWGLQEVPWPLLRLKEPGGRGGEELPIPPHRPRVVVVPKGALSGATVAMGLVLLLVYASSQRRKRVRREAEEAEARERERKSRRRGARVGRP